MILSCNWARESTAKLRTQAGDIGRLNAQKAVCLQFFARLFNSCFLLVLSVLETGCDSAGVVPHGYRPQHGFHRSISAKRPSGDSPPMFKDSGDDLPDNLGN
jgi:hypothetical protein